MYPSSPSIFNVLSRALPPHIFAKELASSFAEGAEGLPTSIMIIGDELPGLSELFVKMHCVLPSLRFGCQPSGTLNVAYFSSQIIRFGSEGSFLTTNLSS